MKNFSSKVKAKVKAKEICCFFVCLFVFGLVLCAMIDLIDWFKKCRVDDYWVSGWVSGWCWCWSMRHDYFSLFWLKKKCRTVLNMQEIHDAKLNFSFISFFLDRFNLMSFPHEKEKNTHNMLRHLSSRTD